MSSKLARVLILAMVVTAMLTVGALQVVAAPPVTNVNTAATYTTIQAAIDDATAGDVISVSAGTYNEALNVNKSVSIIGAGSGATIVDLTGMSGYNNAGIYVSADDVTVQGLTLDGVVTNTVPRYGLKVHAVSGTVIEDVSVQEIYRSGFDLIGSSNATLTDVSSTNNGGHGMALTDCNGVIVTNLTATGNAWSPVSVATWGNYTPLGTSGIVFQGTNSFTGVFQLEQGQYPAGPPELISYSTDIAVGADVTVQASDFSWALSGDDDEDPKYKRVFLFQSWADVVAAAEIAPLGHLTGNYYIHDMVDQTQYYVSSDTNGSIQAAVDAASDGDTVNVAAGTYVEQVVIDGKDLTILGVGDTSVIQSPDDLVEFYTTSKDNYPVVLVRDATVTLDSLKVDGAGKGNANYRMNGVAYVNAGGTIQNCSLVDVRDTPFSGAQHGVALYAWGDDTVSHTLNVWDNVFVGFQKNAMALNADDATPLVVDVRRNTITGAGATSVTAQNGIQVWGAMASGVVADNTVSGIGYSGTGWVATSILNYYADLTISGNTISDAHMGIYNIDGSSDIVANDITVTMIGDYCWAIVASDPPKAPPAPYDPVVMGGMSLKSASLQATDVVKVNDNTVVYSGALVDGTYGIEADAGYGANDLSIEAMNNTVTGFKVGIEIWQGSDTAAVFTSVKANGNDLSGNVIGVRSNADYMTVDATANYWGDASGPGSVAAGSGVEVSADVDYSPWLAVVPGTTPMSWGTDDSIQDAIDMASPGDTIVIAAGTYPGGVVMNKPGITLLAEPGVIIGAGSPAFTVTAANTTIQGFIVDGGGAAGAGIVVDGNADNCTIKGNEIKGWDDGVQITSSATSFKLVGNWIHDNAFAGLRVNSTVVLGGVVTIEGNLFKANGGNGIVNENPATTVVAEYNSWGDAAGPADGDGVSAGVDAEPWTFAEVFMDMVPGSGAVDDPLVSLDEGATFDVKVKVNASELRALDVKVSWEVDWLQFNGMTVAPGAFASATMADLGSGADTAWYSFALLSALPSGVEDVMTLSFTVVDDGSHSPLDPGPFYELFDIDADETSAGATGGINIFVDNANHGATARDIADTDDGQVEISGKANFTGFVDLQGRVNDADATIAVSESATVKATATTVSSGAYTTAHLSGETLVVGQVYDIVIDAPLYLKASVTGVSLDDRPLESLALCKLLGGDATDDESIDIADISKIGGNYGKTSGFQVGADVNIDGQVDILDLVLAAGNYSLVSSPWTP